MTREHAVDYERKDHYISLLKKKKMDHLIMVFTKETVFCVHVMAVTRIHKIAIETYADNKERWHHKRPEDMIPCGQPT